MKVEMKKLREKPALTERPRPAPKGFKFGADPELFIFSPAGEPVSAAGIIPGTKENPYPVDKGAIQVDGMAAEFNIDPAESFEEFNENFDTVIAALYSYLPSGHTLRALPSVTFPQEVFDAAPDTAKELGCSPDFNAWTQDINMPPVCENEPYLRTGSGHIHIGWTEDAEFDDPQHLMNCQDLVKQLDWYLGAWSLNLDQDKKRRLLYGKAGACRYKSYGVEYRVLSNFWVLDKGLRLEVWNRMMLGIVTMRSRFLPEYEPGHSSLVKDAIDKSEVNGALFSMYNDPLVTIPGYFQ